MAVCVTFLGAGDAFNAGGRCHASYLLSAQSGRILLDCGATTLLALKRAGLNARDVDAIGISHLHGDHFSGLPFLLIECVFETPRSHPLTIIGPPGTAARVAELFRAMYRDLASRTLPFELRYVEVDPGTRVQVGEFELFAFRVPHQEFEISLGYRVQIEDKAILYSGDTGWTDTLVEQSVGTDLFICECCYFTTRTDFHLDYPRIAENRSRFGCRRMILTHIGHEVHEHRSEVEMEIADDGMTVDL